jgi:hypothetical protein
MYNDDKITIEDIYSKIEKLQKALFKKERKMK